MNYENSKSHLNKYIESNFPDYTKKQAYNVKFRIKTGWNVPSCKVAIKFKEYLENDKLMRKTEEDLKLSKMSCNEIDQYFMEQERIRKNEIDKKMKINHILFKQKSKNKKLEHNKIFDKLKHDGDIVELVNLEDKDDPEYQDGRITKTFELMRIQNDLFDNAVSTMCAELNTLLKLEFDLHDWNPILTGFYNQLRTEFENKIMVENMNCREKELANMVSRDECISHQEWIKKMVAKGYYCGWPDEDHLGPTSDLDAWVFVGTKWTAEIDKFRNRVDREYLREGYSLQEVKTSRATFVECLFRVEEPEFAKHPKVSLAGYNFVNLNATTISYIKKRFKSHYIDRKIHTSIGMYGKELSTSS